MQPARQLSLSPQDSQYLKERLTGLLEVWLAFVKGIMCHPIVESLFAQ